MISGILSIAVGSASGTPKCVMIKSRELQLYPIFCTLRPGSVLPTVHITSSRIVLTYLNGDNPLDLLTSYRSDSRILLFSAQSWASAAEQASGRIEPHVRFKHSRHFLRVANEVRPW